jgi:hypothetical protein
MSPLKNRIPHSIALLIVMLLVGLTAITCDSFVLYEQIEVGSPSGEEGGPGGGGQEGQPLAISPVSVAVERNSTVSFAATG